MADWASYYVILGSSGAAPIGMQFVVMTLIANRRRRPTADALKAFRDVDRGAPHGCMADLCDHERSVAFGIHHVGRARYLEPFSLLMGQLAYEGDEGPEVAYRFERFAQ